ncbi:hypothetical protein GJ744_012449 [Endocarpon pusillum]|uniref:Trimethyllysine dioxygenase n=1 Tax=Endocarpon pusillum TaxID=364733 RepID=A0A8H7E0B9_9EURO|nr:hypothetical protein GJ744_012449 [Endocarpon pusillum]
MMQSTASATLMKNYLAQPLGITLSSSLKAVTCPILKTHLARRQHGGSWSASRNPPLRFLYSSKKKYSTKSGNRLRRSAPPDHEQPSLLQTGPKSDYPLEGSVTEIEVPGSGTFPFSNLWLRDNCPCSICIHPQTRQRQHDSFEIPLSIGVESCSEDHEGLKIRWNNDGHESHYSWEWLRSWRGSFRPDNGPLEERSSEWAHVDPSRPDHFPTVSFEEVMSSDKGVATWTKKIYQYGFSFVTDCPLTPSATRSLLERIAFVQHTHYGGFWDFSSSATPTDTAYTNQALAVHTDTTYLTVPCGLQMFHLLSHTGGSGGESLFVDGQAAATYLRDKHPSLRNYLHRQKILFHASGNPEVGELGNNTISPEGTEVLLGGRKTICHPSDEATSGHKSEKTALGETRTQIRWNNDDRDTQVWRSLESIERWYRAAREWTRILKMKEFEIKVQLKPGQPIIFDNWRYLHGRTAFSGNRRICGGYVTMDDFLARYRMTNFGPRNGLRAEYFYEQKAKPDEPAPWHRA